MKTTYLYAALVSVAIPAGLTLTTTMAIAGPTYIAENGSDAAVSGYDVTAYFSGAGTPVRGNPNFAVEYRGAQYYFATAENAERFRADPAAFAPQYGGHCAWAMSHGSLAPGDPTAYRVVDGKLYLNFNAEVQRMWLQDIAGFITRADARWPSIPDNARFGGQFSTTPNPK